MFNNPLNMGSASEMFNRQHISFPGVVGTNTHSSGFAQHSQNPITTATSIIAVTFNKGVILAGDLLGSYGSLARFRDCPRILKVNNQTLVGAGGDYGDFQYLKDLIEQKIIDEECLDDGFSLKPKSLYCWLTRVMYNRRSKFDPLWNNFVVAGLQDGKPFLGTVDKLGTAYEDKAICTGYGAHMALPLLRSALEKNPILTESQARDLIMKCMEVLYYRDARSYPKFQVGVVNEQGVVIEGPLSVSENWNLAHMVH